MKARKLTDMQKFYRKLARMWGKRAKGSIDGAYYFAGSTYFAAGHAGTAATNARKAATHAFLAHPELRCVEPSVLRLAQLRRSRASRSSLLQSHQC